LALQSLAAALALLAPHLFKAVAAALRDHSALALMAQSEHQEMAAAVAQMAVWQAQPELA
jgi:hypothetical protein